MPRTPSCRALPDMHNVVFFINGDIAESDASEIRMHLTRSGATEWTPPPDWLATPLERTLAGPHPETACLPAGSRFDPDVVTHVITETISFTEYDFCGDPQADGRTEEHDPRMATVVSPGWVWRSVALGARQAERYYSPDPARIFSGVVVHLSALSKEECELIWTAVLSLGGHFRLNLTKEVTHVIAPCETASALRTLRKPENQGLHMTAVHPAWVNECIKFNVKLSDREFAWPTDREGKPAFLRTAVGPPHADQNAGESLGTHSAPKRQDSMPLPLILPPDDLERAFTSPAPSKGRAMIFQRKDALQGLKILFLPGDISDNSRNMVHKCVLDHGGNWIDPPEDGDLATAVVESDVVVTPFRDSEAGMWALHLGKRLATSSWLWYVIAYGRLVEPLDHILHFPPPKAPIPSFTEYTFTLSNYTGEARAYLKELIRRAGAHWTPEMTQRNTHLLTASLRGEKSNRASAWGIKAINHTWLEDCIVTWSERPIEASSSYTHFPDDVKMQDLVGRARLDRDVLRPWIVQAHEWVETHTHAAYALQETIAPRKGVDEAAAPRRTSSQEEKGAVEVGKPKTKSTAAGGAPLSEANDLIEAAAAAVEREATAAEREATAAEREATTAEQEATAAEREATAAEREATTAEREATADEREATASREATPEAQKPRRKQAKGEKRPVNPTTPGPHTPEAATSPLANRSKAKSGKSLSKNAVNDIDETVDPAAVSPAAEPASSRTARKKPETSSTIKKKQTRRKDPADEGTSARRTPRTGAADVSGVWADTPSRGKKRVRGDPASSQGPTSTPVRETSKRHYTTTGVELSAADEKQLRRLGWVKQGDVTGATEVLVAKSLQRTPKLLCAVARGADVVTPDWVGDMVRSGEAMDPADYVLKDQKNEKARGMTLVTSLERARGADGGLLAGHTFMFTSKVTPSEETLRSIVIAAGGKAPKKSLNTDHILDSPGTVHVISSEADRRLWDQMSEDVCVDGSRVQVWTGELILDGVLRQDMQWDKHKLMG